ncbi:hypothetical protein GMPD_37960 [Geomonas paludis]|uniref:Uncharacterized protein n=1 Tax=Geomonas paludis TaxID=2740185 RepID=A0A6V8N1U7_9BACT|nr:hypothetical protein GMPD_37960 [Geomonas paludis]
MQGFQLALQWLQGRVQIVAQSDMFLVGPILKECPNLLDVAMNVAYDDCHHLLRLIDR